MTEKQAVEKTNYAPQPAGGGGEQTVSSQIDMINEAYNQEQQVLGGLESSARSQEETASNKCLMIFSKEMQHFWLQEAGGVLLKVHLGMRWVSVLEEPQRVSLEVLKTKECLR